MLLPREHHEWHEKAKNMTPEDEHPRSEGVQYATRKEWKQLLIDPERMKR